MTGYESWSVIAGETPTATKWNYIGDNMDLFNDEFDARVPAWVDLVDGATIDVNFNNGYNKYFRVTLGGNRALTFSNPAYPQTILIALTQGSPGSRTVSYPAGCKFEFDVEPVLSTTTNDVDLLMVTAVSSGVYYVIHAGNGLR